MTGNQELRCHVCGIVLPNKWAVARREIVDGAERCYCHLHANSSYGNKNISKGDGMQMNTESDSSAREREIARSASGERVNKAWSECSSLAAKLGGGVKALWAKIHPDRSPEAMLTTLNADLAENHRRLGEMKPALDQAYREIVSRKREYQTAAPVRQRLLRIELQTLMTRYKGLEREFTILCENERSIEAVKSRFLEVLAYGLRGKLDVAMVDRLSDDIDDKADEAEDVQDALGDLERAGRRTDRSADDFDSELAGFDGELGLSDQDTLKPSDEKENENAHDHENADAVRDDGVVA